MEDIYDAVTVTTGCSGDEKFFLPESATSIATPSLLSTPPTWCFWLLPGFTVTSFPPLINDATQSVVFRVAMDSLITWR